MTTVATLREQMARRGIQPATLQLEEAERSQNGKIGNTTKTSGNTWMRSIFKYLYLND